MWQKGPRAERLGPGVSPALSLSSPSYKMRVLDWMISKFPVVPGTVGFSSTCGDTNGGILRQPYWRVQGVLWKAPSRAFCSQDTSWPCLSFVYLLACVALGEEMIEAEMAWLGFLVFPLVNRECLSDPLSLSTQHWLLSAPLPTQTWAS